MSDNFEVEDNRFRLKKSRPTLLITPLNWGLGHATRCIPIIQQYLDKEWNVLIAGDGVSLELLKSEFPNQKYFTLPGYNIQYWFKNMYLNILFQWPKILIAALKENFAVREIIKSQQIDLLISDSRFGCFSNKTKSIFITHQLNIQIGFPPLQKLVNYFNHGIIRKFDECWVPDNANHAISGQLSIAAGLSNLKYIGILSRMKNLNIESQWELLVVLSGPEPQRSIFEKLVLTQIRNLSIKTIIVQGLTGKKIQQSLDDHTKLISYATSEELNEMICASKVILCRSGYSSLMDLAATQKRAMLVPTPGQTEQEYLAQYLSEKGYFLFQNQNEFNLALAMDQVSAYNGFPAEMEINNFPIL